MNHRERFHRLMAFEPVDRLPRIEWATWWNQTIDRWKTEGLPVDRSAPGDIHDYFGLDPYRQFWLSPHRPTFPRPAHHGASIVNDLAEYEAVKPHLYPEPDEVLDADRLRACAERQRAGEMVIWVTLNGFFWYSRTLLGIAPHLTAFYEAPEIIHRMNRDLLDFTKRVFEAFAEICVPDYMTFAEDMSYNHGPMISKLMFDEFMAPYYLDIVPLIRRSGTIPFIDSDGDVIELIPWFGEVGVDGFLPLERQAGCDLYKMRQRYPHARFIGAFDKMVMTNGEPAMRQEFERLLPVMRQGGFIPSVDHQTPPGVSMDEYRVYLRLLDEYTGRAGDSLYS